MEICLAWAAVLPGDLHQPHAECRVHVTAVTHWVLARTQYGPGE
jgi:hypothetical protein